MAERLDTIGIARDPGTGAWHAGLPTRPVRALWNFARAGKAVVKNLYSLSAPAP
jgi:hypothetical protein